MSKKSNLTIPMLLILAVFVMLVIPSLPRAETYQEHDPLAYDVDVRAQIIPIFAIDAKGEPVFDLKEEEIELFVDGKKVEIALFSSPYTQEGKKRAETIGLNKQGDPVELQSPDRINFLVVDSLSNTQKGFAYAKKIAEGIIEQSPSSDAFVVMESSFLKGFKYIGGPENDKKKLIGYLGKLERIEFDRTLMGSSFMVGNPNSFTRGSTGTIGDLDASTNILDMLINEAKTDANSYQNVLKNYFNTLLQLKYTLKTISNPKHVYIISGGFTTAFMASKVAKYFQFMGDAAKAINNGGCSLTIIDSVPEQSTQYTHNLKTFSEEGGGKYIKGDIDYKKTLAKTLKNTQAYYELSFFPDEEKNMKIEVKCKRKGVSLQTVKYAEKGNSYKEMEPLQKEIFAINVITDGSWSRIVGNVQQVKLNEVKKENTNQDSNQSNIKYIQVPIPEKIKGLDVDVFAINMDPLTMKSDIIKTSQTAGQFVEVKVPVKDNNLQYVVIVEPTSTSCFYNLVL